MKSHKNYLMRLPRVVQSGAVIGATIFAAYTLQAQPIPPNPATPAPSAASANPASQTLASQPSITQDPATANRTLVSPTSTSTVFTRTSSSTLSHKAKEFLKDAAESDQAEIAMANVAEGKSQNTQVKDLAQTLRAAHEKNYQAVQALAQAHDVKIDTRPDMMDKHAANRLQNASDANFDKEYTKMMLKDHVKCIKRFDKAVADVREMDIEEYAQDTLPKLRNHLRRSEDAARAVGVEESTIDSIVKGLPNEDQAVTSR